MTSATVGASPSRRAWLRFRRNRLGFWSLVIFCVLVVLSLGAELVSNDRPLVVRYEGQTYFPIARDYAEKTFGGRARQLVGKNLALLLPGDGGKDNFILDVNSQDMGESGLTDKGGKANVPLRRGSSVIKIQKEGYLPEYVVVTPETEVTWLMPMRMDKQERLAGVGKVAEEGRPEGDVRLRAEGGGLGRGDNPGRLLEFALEFTRPARFC